MSKRILITGPISGLHRYASAAESAGWDAECVPLLTVRAQALASNSCVPAPALLLVTSHNALEALEPHAEALRGVPFATVGARSAARLADWGLTPHLPPASSGDELTRNLLAGDLPSGRVLWPRGSVSNAIEVVLRQRGIAIDAPVAYVVEPGRLSHPLESFDAVFFASPSAVARYNDLVGAADDRERIAFAIGRTTAAALAEERFREVRVLRHPTPGALDDALSDDSQPHP